MLCVVFLAECAGTAIDEIGLHVQDHFQSRLVLQPGDRLILLAERRSDLGVVIGCVDDLISQPQSHQLVAGVYIGTQDGLRHLGKGHLGAVLGGQGEGEGAVLLGLAGSRRAAGSGHAGGGGGAAGGGLRLLSAGGQGQHHGKGKQGGKGLFDLFHMFSFLFHGTKNTSFPDHGKRCETTKPGLSFSGRACSLP